MVEGGRVEIHLGDPGLVQLAAEGLHRFVAAGKTGAKAQGRQPQILHGRAFRQGPLDHGRAGLKPTLVGPGFADGILNAEGCLGWKAEGDQGGDESL